MSNGVMFQYFEWNLPNDGKLWQNLAHEAQSLAEKGVTAVWIPPAYKATSTDDVGYSVYDLFDLGEFDQKGEVRTKYGTKAELMRAAVALHEAGIAVYADAVLNHKGGADFTETFLAIKVDPDNREDDIGEPYEIEGWTGFDFPGREDREASDFVWHWYHFTGVDYDNKTGEKAIFRVVGDDKGWSQDVSREHGNFDYLMHADIDHSMPEVKEELIKWGKWYIDQLDLDGFRMDAIKHISADFMQVFAEAMRADREKEFYFVGEYWDGDFGLSKHCLSETNYTLDLFDVKLHFNFEAAGKQGKDYDLRTIFNDTIVQKSPLHAVTFVDNHDSQPGQSLESTVQDWFKESAYALILLRVDGYPCVFYGDYYGTGDGAIQSHKDKIDRLLLLRRWYARGEQYDYFEAAEVIGWLRIGEGEDVHPMAVVMTTQDEEQHLSMEVGKHLAGTTFADFLGNQTTKVTIDENGWGTFPVQARSVSCFLLDGLPLDNVQVDDVDVDAIEVDPDEPLSKQSD
ncbi:MAG TPA: alpha-amylase [Clostridiaceae bacterium]|nr:alpha-amylase [Clostridiaceae bacterium]